MEKAADCSQIFHIYLFKGDRRLTKIKTNYLRSEFSEKMFWVFSLWDTHSAVSSPPPAADITLLDDIISQRRALHASIRHFLWRRGAAVCLMFTGWISTRHLMLRAALTPAAHTERPYWKIHMSLLRRNMRAASRTREQPRDESECVSSLIFQLMSPDEENKRSCRSEDENVSECFCHEFRLSGRRRFLLTTELIVNLSVSVRTTWFIPKQGFH